MSLNDGLKNCSMDGKHLFAQKTWKLEAPGEGRTS